MDEQQQKDAIELLKEATEAHPDIVYGRESAVISHTDMVNWLHDWIPRAQNFLDGVDG